MLAVRTVAIGVSVFIIFVAAAAGAAPVTAQKALEAPRPSGAARDVTGVVLQVGGTSARTWHIGQRPLPANAAPINPPSGPFPDITLACAGAGNCTAVGHYYASDHT